jgi:UDP-N-acetylmuramate--alanine ligase
MKELKDIHAVYFIGIGGIGMSALARYFKFHGRKVSGYDRTETPLTRALVDEGISVHYEDDPGVVDKKADLVVYTPALPGDLKELAFYREHDYEVLKRSDVLGLISNSSFNICVAGTHGKTTVSTMIAHILRDSGYGCNAFLGGISVNYNSNFWSNERAVCVVEADEYDRSFLKLKPDIAVITAMDADHLDIYGTEKAIEDAFIDFADKLKTNGLLLNKFGLKRGGDLKAANHFTYSLDNIRADVFTENRKLVDGSYLFDVIGKGWKLPGTTLNMGGMHNVENATVAIAVAQGLGIEGDKIRKAVAGFKGVKRRFEYVVRKPSQVYIDDYAHHPAELRALISSARALFPTMKCTVVFQPHLYSRTKDFAEGFAESLDLANEVILLPLYPARELPMEGVSSSLILGKMKISDKRMMNMEEITKWLKIDKTELLITAGAGDIDKLVMPFKQILEQKN